jgi:glycosyltransferase involved in cell wall biosynthesis
MKIAYCTNVRLPSERAHGHQIAQVCDALDALGHDVTVFAPFRRNPVTVDYHAYYGARTGVTLKLLGSFDPINRWWLPGVTGLWVLNAQLRQAYRRELRAMSYEIAYTRAPALLPALIASGVPTVLELHQLPYLGRFRFIQLAKRCRLIVCLTSSMRETLITWGIPASIITVEGDAVDLRRFAHLPSKESARTLINLKTDRLVVGYIGRLKTLGMEKGVKHLLEAIANLQSSKKFTALIVGGPDGDRREYEAMARELGLTEDDVRFTGEVPARAVPSMIAACDILAMPFPDLPHYRHHMSPLKMFEYMAAERPIITSDLPTVRDVLGEETAFFCRPGDSTSLAAALEEIAANSAEASRRANNARKLVQNHTWEERMKRIIGVLA